MHTHTHWLGPPYRDGHILVDKYVCRHIRTSVVTCFDNTHMQRCTHTWTSAHRCMHMQVFTYRLHMHKDTLIHRTLQTHKSVHIHVGRHKHTQYAHTHACEHTECMCIYSSACVGVRIYIGEFINKTVHTSNSIYVCVYTYTNTVDNLFRGPIFGISLAFRFTRCLCDFGQV